MTTPEVALDFGAAAALVRQVYADPTGSRIVLSDAGSTMTPDELVGALFAMVYVFKTVCEGAGIPGGMVLDTFSLFDLDSQLRDVGEEVTPC